jgi:hypothetical protein
MSDLKYVSGFYIIEVATEQYDLFNSVTDNKILEAEPKEKIISFLQFNLPYHPFLLKNNQDTDWGYFTSTTEYDINKYITYVKEELDLPYLDSPGPDDPDDPCYFVEPKYEFNYDNYTGTPVLNEFYSSFNYDNAGYCNGFVEEEVTRDEVGPVQLEFDFTNKDNKDKETISPNDSTDNEEDNIPYLPDDEEGDTE